MTNVERLMVAYAVATLLHFAHNATYVDAYPNLPEWISFGTVWAAWFAETAVGVGGYVLARQGFRWGLVLVGIWAALGFDGFAHYALAPMARHTTAMNVSIWFEATTGALLLATLALRAPRALRVPPSR